MFFRKMNVLKVELLSTRIFVIDIWRIAWGYIVMGEGVTDLT